MHGIALARVVRQHVGQCGVKAGAAEQPQDPLTAGGGTATGAQMSGRQRTRESNAWGHLFEPSFPLAC